MCRLLLRVLAAVVLVTGLTGNLRAADRPNVLFLFSDDQRFDTIHALGNDQIQTPNLDRLVHNGFTFTHAYCMGAMQGAVCVPSRAMLLSGRSLFHVPTNLPPDVPLWPEVLGKAGYATFATGKWHNGPASFGRTFQDGGTIFFGGMANHLQVPVHDFDRSGKYDKKAAHVGKAFSSEMFADTAIRFLRGHKGDRPFCLYVAFTAPHDPRMPPKEYADRYDPAHLALPKNFLPIHPFNNGDMKGRDEALAPWPRTPEVVRQHTAAYYGMITHLDAQVGRILAALEETGQAKNTLVVFTSDHGLAVGRHGLFGKQNLYEHSMRPPLVFAGPGIPQDKKSDALCYLFDLFPTICDLTGVATPAGVDGKSLAPILAGKGTKVRDTLFCAYRDLQRSMRDGRWKLIRYPHINKSQLFDLQDDPDELHDLAADAKYADRLQAMTALLKEWQQQVGDKQRLSTDKPAPLHIDLHVKPGTKGNDFPRSAESASAEPLPICVSSHRPVLVRLRYETLNAARITWQLREFRCGIEKTKRDNMKHDKQIVWVIMHYEFMGLPASPHVDSVQFHVSSSLKKAEKYIRSTCVDAHSWWQIHPHVLDAAGDDLSTEGDEVYYYSHRGTPLKSAPVRRAGNAFQKHRARYLEFYSSPPPDEV